MAFSLPHPSSEFYLPSSKANLHASALYAIPIFDLQSFESQLVKDLECLGNRYLKEHLMNIWSSIKDT
ncbi:hypothetical protein OSB04_025257 [Centaurea solstitialis]|uniref:Uncharacterized protein n=1 Tax=Centaurea solstitialis TaxID=347529 RepID=A0AA38SMR4_9ASTR|nr:hypothetical protein OSB04_025257 [Centaurea solstitialis]